MRNFISDTSGYLREQWQDTHKDKSKIGKWIMDMNGVILLM